MKTIQEWNDILVEMTDKTDYCVLTKRSINSPVVAIVPKEKDFPQIIAIYPKKTKNPGLVLMYDAYNRRKIQDLVGEPNRIHSNRPHFSNVEEQTIIDVCKAFLLKD
jgi:hypothetical protein